MSKTIYVDNAATTPVSKPVLDAMTPFFCEAYGNPSSIFYSVGAAAGEALAAAREKAAKALGCAPDELYLNRLCRAIDPMNDTDTEKLNAVVLMAEAPDIVSLCQLAENLEQFRSEERRVGKECGS